MPQIDASGFKERLKKLKRTLPIVAERSMRTIGNKMKRDIVTGAARSYSPSWMRAIHRNGPHRGQPYFLQGNSGFGLLDVIRNMPVQVVKTRPAGAKAGSKSVVSLSFGDISMLDSEAPYWRLFEFGGPGRTGGSSTHGFLPTAAGMGTMTPIGKRRVKTGVGPKDWATVTVGPHPGVLPVHLFSDTFQHYKKIIRRDIRSKIRKAVKTI